MSWQPNQHHLMRIVSLLKPTNMTTEGHKQMIHELNEYGQKPEFMNYLAYLLAHSQELEVRQRAGLYLKRMVLLAQFEMDEKTLQNVTEAVVNAVGSQDRQMQRVAGQILAALGYSLQTRLRQSGDALEHRDRLHFQVHRKVVEHLIGLIDSQNPVHKNGSLYAISLLCEDTPDMLDSEEMGRPLNVLIPKLISLFQDPDKNVRKYAVTCVMEFIHFMPQALQMNMDRYLQGLFTLTADATPEVRRMVCKSLVFLVEIKFDHLRPQLANVVEFMLMCTANKDDPDTALEACEFWMSYASQEVPQEVEDPRVQQQIQQQLKADFALLQGYLPKLVPVLLDCMVYSEEELMMLGDQEDDHDVADRDQDIRPTFHKSREVGGGAAEDEDEDWNEDTDMDWSLRKCAAASMDKLSALFHDHLLQVLFPLLEQRLRADNWLVQESGVLALGAIATGCYDQISQYLAQLVPFLIGKLDHGQALMRSITCWTLSRYAHWVVSVSQDDATYLRPLIEKLLMRVLDPNKRVQEAACSAFATLEETAGPRLVPYLNFILLNLMRAFRTYQAKNMLILYDAIGTLAETVGNSLNRPEFIQILMPPLMERWDQLHSLGADPDDHAFFPLLECVTSVAQALGQGFHPFARPVFQSCLAIIEQNLLQCQRAQQALEQGHDVELPDKTYIVCSLDLLGGLVEGLGASVESLVGQPECNLPELLFQCLHDDEQSVRQSAFALLGDLAKSCVGRIRPNLGDFIRLAASNLDPQKVSVCNNSSWAIGEIAIKVGPELEPMVPAVMEPLVKILLMSQKAPPEPMRPPPPSLLVNAAITIGRLALVCPQAVAQQLHIFAVPWCTHLCEIKDEMERMHAYQGLCSAIKLNPQGVLPAFRIMCFGFAKMGGMPEDDHYKMFHGILVSFKQMLGDQWEQHFGTCEPELRDYLKDLYRL